MPNFLALCRELDALVAESNTLSSAISDASAVVRSLEGDAEVAGAENQCLSWTLVVQQEAVQVTLAKESHARHTLAALLHETDGLRDALESLNAKLTVGRSYWFEYK